MALPIGVILSIGQLIADSQKATVTSPSFLNSIHPPGTFVETRGIVQSNKTNQQLGLQLASFALSQIGKTFIPDVQLDPDVSLGFQSLAPSRPVAPPTTFREAIPIIFDFILNNTKVASGNIANRVETIIGAIIKDGQLTVDDIDLILQGGINGGISIGNAGSSFAGNGVENFISGFTNPVSATIDKTTAAIEGFLRDQLDKITGFIESSIVGVTEAIVGVVDQISNFLDRVIGGLVETISRGFERAFASLTDVIARIVSSVVDTLTGIVTSLGRAIDRVFDGIGTLVRNVQGFVERALDAITSAVNRGLQSIVNLANQLQQSMRDLIDALFTSARAILGRLTDILAELPGAIRALSDDAIRAFEEFIGQPLTALPEALQKQIAGALNDIASEDTARVAQAGQFAYFGTITAQDSREQFRKLFTETLPEQPIIRYIVQTLLAVFILFQLGTGMAQAQSQLILQEFSLNTPSELLRAGDSIRALHFGEIDRETAVLNIRRSGFTEDDANRLINTGETVPTETDLLRWWLRGIIDDTEIDRRFEGRGYNSDERARFREAAFFIPPVADLISMAVREAFSPEVAERFGQFEDFPAPFAEAAAKQGVSDEWARRYWAAHWGLPSVQMGFEMLHRGVIESEDLNLLLRAQDIMPFWRDKLTQISFSPLTRVDVRRMHKLGVLSRDEVKRSYSDLGYNDENAERLTAFTVELNAPRVAEDDTELSQLSRGAILGLFEDGIVDRDRAKLLMVGVGVSDDAAELFLDSKEMDIERVDRGDQKALIIEQAKVGQLSFQEAQDALAGLGLETVEQERATVKLVRQEASKTRLPTRANLDDFLEAELIDEAEYIETMARLGFTRKWTDRFLGLIKGG